MTAPYPATAPPRFAGYGEDAGLELPDLGPAVEREIIQRLTSRTFDDWAEAAARVGYCSRPIRVRGSSTTIDSQTGEVLSTYDSSREPFGVLHLRCGDRRADRCPSCSRVYAADTFHLIRSGVAGGKGVPTTVARNPLVFATLTAPSFGHVHGQRANGRRCRHKLVTPLRCPHGRRSTCMRVHTDDDPLLGQPLCRDCYDYTSQIVWQWWAPELWRRFTIALRRLVARALGVRPSALADHATVQYAKVAEYQLRGVIHFHALIRIDGPRSDTGFAPAPPKPSTPRRPRPWSGRRRGRCGSPPHPFAMTTSPARSRSVSRSTPGRSTWDGGRTTRTSSSRPSRSPATSRSTPPRPRPAPPAATPPTPT